MGKAKAGSLIQITRGEYSDFYVKGFFVALVDFDPREELKLYLEKHAKQYEGYLFDDDMFLAFIIKKGLLLEINHNTLHLGAYGSWTEVSFTPYKNE